MNTITQDTAISLAYAHREIQTAQKLLDRILNARDSKEGVDFRDAFGRRRELHLGIPSGDTATQLYNVSPALAEYVIVAHIARKESEVVALSWKALMEVNGTVPTDEEHTT